MSRTRKVRALLGGLVASLLLGVPAATGGDESPGKRWHRGPVRYLLSEEDIRRFTRLKSPGDRQVFVDAFWQRLDPDPRTPRNEFRDRFEARCDQANRRFGTVRGAGWTGDRGRVFILFGEPGSIRRDAGDAIGRDREIWSYGAENGLAGPPVEIVFRRNMEGAFVLTFDADAGVDETLTPWQLPETRRRLRNQYPGLRAGEIDLLIELIRQRSPDTTTLQAEGGDFDLADIPNLPDDLQGASALTDTGFDLVDRVYLFRAADGSVLGLAGLELRTNATPSPGAGDDVAYRAWALVRDRAAGSPEQPAPVYHVPLAQQAELSSEGIRIFAGNLFFRPGRAYDVRYVLVGRERKTLLIRDRLVTAPTVRPDRLAVSSVVPAERFGPAGAEDDSPFAIGSEEVIPRLNARFRRSEPMRFYLQVYGAGRDPRTDRPRVDVRFEFRRRVKQRLKRHGRPLSVRGAEGASMGLALPIGDWPPGVYQARVELTDRVTGARAAEICDFRVLD